MPKIYKPKKKKKNQLQSRSMATRSVSPDHVGNALSSLVMQVSPSHATQTGIQRLALFLRVFILVPPSLGLGLLFFVWVCSLREFLVFLCVCVWGWGGGRCASWLMGS